MILYREFYIVQVQSEQDKTCWNDEEYFHPDNRSMEELKQVAIDKKKELEETYIDEKFRVILMQENIEVIE